MGSLQAEKPQVGEEGVGPVLMVDSSASAFLVLLSAEHTPQTHPQPAVEPLEAGQVLDRLSEPAERLRRDDARDRVGPVGVDAR